MSVFKRGGKGNYYIQFNYRGKTYVKSSKSTNKRIAERMEREWHDDIIRREELGELPRITLKEALTEYAAEKKATGSSQYAGSNVSVLNKLFPTELYIDELKSWHLSKFKSARQKDDIGAQTIKHNFQAIRSAIAWAKDHGYKVTQLDYPKVKLPKHRLRYLSKDEEVRLLAELDPYRDRPYRPSYQNRPAAENKTYHDNYDLVVLLLDTGARYSEIANIHWESLDLENKLIRLWRNKVKNESLIYMTTRVAEIIQRRFDSRDSAEYLFTNKSGGPRGYQAKGIRAAIKRAGIDSFTIHDLRHTCASRLVQAGLSLYEVANVLGHTDVSTTQIYAHLENKDVSKKARDMIEAFSAAS